MDYRSLGNSGLKVPVLCLGAMTFGDADDKSTFMHKVGCDEKTSFAIMSRALERGVAFIDTADVYGQDGLSERIVGSWMAETKSRDRIVLATKFRFRMGEGANGTGASRYRIVRTVEESLKRLKTDRIDLYQIHMQDVETPEEETLRALDDLVRAGKVLYLGASNYTAYRLTDSQWIARTEHLHRFVALQMQYSLLSREAPNGSTCRSANSSALGILLVAARRGLSSRASTFETSPLPPACVSRNGRSASPPSTRRRGWRTLDAVNAVAREKGDHGRRRLLAWLLAKPTVTSVIFGARSLAHLDDNLKGADVEALARRRPEARRRQRVRPSATRTPFSANRSRSAGDLRRGSLPRPVWSARVGPSRQRSTNALSARERPIPLFGDEVQPIAARRSNRRGSSFHRLLAPFADVLDEPRFGENAQMLGDPLARDVRPLRQSCDRRGAPFPFQNAKRARGASRPPARRRSGPRAPACVRWPQARTGQELLDEPDHERPPLFVRREYAGGHAARSESRRNPSR